METPQTELILYGRRPHEAEWQESILTVTTEQARIDEVTKLATAAGFIGLRVATFKFGQDFPDFAATIRK